MTPTLTAILGAVRMADMGISVVLTQLCANRLLDKYRRRELPFGWAKLGPINPDSIVIIGFVMGISMGVSFLFRVTNHLWQWPSTTHFQIVRLIALWGTGIARVNLIYVLAYHRRRQMLWCAGWVIASHIIILGALWTRIS